MYTITTWNGFPKIFGIIFTNHYSSVLPEYKAAGMKQQIIQGDCLEVMKTFPDKSFDCVITDPPYGIGADKGVGGFGSSKTDKHYEDNWDSQSPAKEYFDEIIRISKMAIIFGGQFFTDKLPVNGHWIVWDKKGGGTI